MKTTRFKRWLFASDLHGPLQHKPTVKALLAFKDSFQPDLTIFGGDLFDLRALLKRATDEDKSVSIVQDVDAGMDFLRVFRPSVLLWGNHDHRLQEMTHSRDAVRSGLASKLLGDIDSECAALGIKTVPWGKRHGVYRMGDLTFLHGYAAGVGAVRKHALSYGNCIHGHIHAVDCVSIETLQHITGRSAGALCELDLDYNLGHIGTLRHAHGWAYGVTDTRTGHYYAAQAQEIAGKWFHPDGFTL